MAVFYIPGERKTRPGVFYRYENWGAPPLAGAADGRCAAVFASNWGPMTQVVIEKSEDIEKVYGDGGANGTTAVPIEQFKGGARLVFAVRVGVGGAKGSYQIKDTAEAPVLQLTMLYPGSKEFAITIRPTLADPDIAELLILEGTTELERIAFPATAGSDQVSALMDTVATAGSKYFTLTKIADSVEAIATVDQDPITAGTDPTVNAGAYSAAFEALEASRWNVLAVDTSDPAIHLLTQMYLNRIYAGGKFVMGVIGEPGTGVGAVPFETRLKCLLQE